MPKICVLYIWLWKLVFNDTKYFSYIVAVRIISGRNRKNPANEATFSFRKG